MIKIICSNCQKPLTLDEAKLPPREVSFPCPVCKSKLTVDGRALSPGETVTVPAQPPHDDVPNPAASAAPSTPIPSTPLPSASASALSEAHDEADGFGAKALIVGTDHPALRHAAKMIGFLPVHMATAAQAREYFVQEYPTVVILSPGQLTPPPLESMQPIMSLTPADRRRSFFILIADNLRTLDGNAAFLYNVNLVVAPKDLNAFTQIYREAHTYHERLYSSMNSVTKALHLGE
jgi:hypothetical protein